MVQKIDPKLHEIFPAANYSRITQPTNGYIILINPVQGDHSGCGNPPVDTKTKVPF